ncbi:Hypothetical predicted protein, partial [Paramuricea clavata]
HIVERDPCSSKDVIAYYKCDGSFRDVCFGNNAVKYGNFPQPHPLSGILNGAADFESSRKLRIPSLNAYKWGSKLSVSLWFQSTSRSTAGIINNGAVYTDVVRNKTKVVLGSWEMRITRGVTESNENRIGAAIVTSHSAKAWDNITTVFSNHWHHLIMVYNGKKVGFYLDSHLKFSESLHGEIVTKNSEVVIGQTKYGTNYGSYDYGGYFSGFIDEVKLFKKALNAHEVQQLYWLKSV